MPTLRTEVKLFLLLSLWLVFGLGYFQRFPLPDFIFKCYLVALAGLVAGSAYGYGSALMNRTLLGRMTVTESLLMTTALGFGLISLLMFVFGVIGLWTRTGAVSLVSGGLLLGWHHYKKHIHTSFLPTAIGSPPKVPLFLIGIGTILSFLIAFAPVTYYDSLVYHLALPQTYIQAGRWVGQTELIYSAFPQSMEMLWTLGMLLAGDTLANLLGWMIAMIGLLAVYEFGKRFFGHRTGAWAAALLGVMPAYMLLSSGGYIDVGLMVFSFLSFYAISLWKESRDFKFLILAGAFAGFAMGTKYTGGIPFAIGALLIGLQSGPRIRNWTAYIGSASLVFSPWLLKNLYYVGNPVFPFFYRFSLKNVDVWLGDAAQGYFRGLTEYAPRSGWQLLKLIWDIAVNGFQFGGGMDVLGDLGWAALFAFLPALWLVRKKASPLLPLLLYALCFFIPWGMSRPVLRFLIPLAPILALAGAYGFVEGIGSQKKGIRLVSHAFLGLLLSSNLLLFFDVSDTLSLFKVPLGFQSRVDYLSEKLNYYPAAAYVNSLPENSLTYVVGDQRGYYYNRPVLVTPVFNKNPLTDWANESASAKELGSNLKSRGITHLLINHSELYRLDSAYHLFPWSAKGKANWDGLCARLAKKLYHDRHCEVLAL